MGIVETEFNEAIAEQIRDVLKTEERVSKAVRGMEEGYLKFFVRNGTIQKLYYKHSELESSGMYLGQNDEALPFDQVEKIPADVYRRFSYILSTIVMNEEYPIEHGTLVFNFKFYKNNNDWQEEIHYYHENEIHFKFNR